MKYRNLLKRITVTAGAAVLASGTTAVPVGANAAQTYWEGVSRQGVFPSEKECPVCVEHEKLLFEIENFPHMGYGEARKDKTGGTVTAEYTFYNPADYAVKAVLLFPFGNLPAYAEIRDPATGERLSRDDPDRYGVTAGGQEVKADLRHTFSLPYQEFELEAALAGLQDSTAEDLFYEPDLQVIRYTFSVSGVNEETNPAACGKMVLQTDTEKSRLWLEESRGMGFSEEGLELLCSAENGEDIHLYILGEQPEQTPEWTVYTDGGADQEAEGRIELAGTERMTFYELAMTEYEEASGVTENDWYNAAVGYFRSGETVPGLLDLWEWGQGLDFSGLLMQWYEYEITVGPGERLVNTVTAPLYPDVDTGDDPSLYRYTYLLSPARTWKSFGTLEIEIRTPYRMQESSLEGFTPWEDGETAGYRLELSGLPEGELTFTLEGETEGNQEPAADAVRHVAVVAAVCLLVCAASVVLVAVLRARAKRDGDSSENGNS